MAFPVQPFLAVLDNEYENDDDSNNIDDEKYQEPCKKNESKYSPPCNFG